MSFLNPAENPTGFTIFILIVTIVPILGSFIWRQKWQRTLLTGGMEGGNSATGVITGIGQSGMEINGQPQLTFTVQVQPALGGAPYEARIKQTIPQMALGMLAPGRPVALVVSPKNPSKVKIDLQGTANLAATAGAAAFGGSPGAPGFGGAPAGFGGAPGAPGFGGAPAGFGTPSFGSGQMASPTMAGAPGGAPQAMGNVRSNDDLIRATDAVPATVVSMQETGQMFGTDPIVVLTLQVQATTGAYQMQAGYRVPLDRRSRLMPGVVVRAHPDPTNQNAVGIDWRAL